MPKKLNISSNERVDLEDFNRASAGYTQESDNFDRQKLLLSGRSLVSSGFRIEISDQATSPGEFTIYNGVAVDKSGNLLNNEQQVADARTITLSGAGLDFYIEIEFVETESDVDARAFWDPTFSGNNPPGKEFSLNVATRLTPDWQVVQPVSTSDFDIVTTGASSTKIPVAVLTTNGSNEITGFTAVNASTTLEEDAGAADLTLRVVDSTVFPTTGTATVGGTSVNITANDRANGILTISPAMGVARQAGAVVVETGVTAAFVPQSDVAAPPTGNVGDADRRRRLFAGDETRGSAMSADPEDAAARADVNVAGLKDYVDFLAAQIRELKFGSLRTDETSTLPPSTFTSTRHYDSAGSVTGARAHSITIGDGVSSFGDLNTDTDDLGTVVGQAHAALDATNGGSVFIKKGTYVWDSVVNSDRPLTVEFEQGCVFGAGSYNSVFFSPSDADKLTVINAPDASAQISPYALVSTLVTADAAYELVDCYTGYLSLADGNNVTVRNCVVTGTATNPPISLPNSPATSAASLVVRDSTIRYSGTASLTTAMVTGILSNCTFEDCVFDSALDVANGCGKYMEHSLNSVDLTNFRVRRCSFSSTQTGAVRGAFDFDLSTATMSNVLFDEITVDPTWSGTVSTDLERSLMWFEGGTFDNVTISNSDFSTVDTINSTTEADQGRIISITDATGGFGQGLKIVGNTFGRTGAWTASVITHIYINETFGGRNRPNEIRANRFYDFNRGIYLEEGSIKVVDNVFYSSPSAGTTDIIAIASSSAQGKELNVVANKITIDGDTSVSKNAFGITFEDIRTVISNNHFEMQCVSGVNAAIADTATITGGVISDNYILSRVETAGTSVYGMYFTALSMGDLAITGNSMLVVTNGSASDVCVGIRHSGSSGTSNCTISNNIIEVSQIIDDAYCHGIWLTEAYGTTISGNTVDVGFSGTDHIIGYYLEDTANGVVLDGNIFRCQGTAQTATSYFGTGIWLSATTGATLDNNVVSNNYIEMRGEIINGIALLGGTSTAKGNVISGNSIINGGDKPTAGGSFPYGASGIYVRNFNTTDGSSSFHIVGNSIVEESVDSAADNLRSGIYCDSGTTNHGAILNISGNAIVGEANFDRQQGGTDQGGAIFVDDAHSVVVQGNMIHGWSSTSTSAANIKITGFPTYCGVYSNVCDPEETVITAQENWEVNGTWVHFHGNMSIGATETAIAGTTEEVTDNMT